MILNAIDNQKLKANTYKARFLEAGLVKYGNEMVLIKQENLYKIASKFKGCKVIIDHDFSVDENNTDKIIGYITNIWMEQDGWAWCDFTVNDSKAISLIDQGYSVSCAYEPVTINLGGVKNNVPYDKEVIDIVENDAITHLAIVKTPRYEGATILQNGIDNINKKIMNIFKFGKTKEAEKSFNEIDRDNSFFEIDGKEVAMAELEEVYKNSLENKVEEACKKAMVNADDEFDVDGTMVKVSDMANAYKASKDKEAEEALKNAEDEKAKEEKEKEDEEAAKKEIKENSLDLEEIKKSKEVFENGLEMKNPKIITEADKLKSGSAAYGSRKTK
jgi:ribosomal protein L12E/L44/L45/RPP1/RPP2